MNKGIYNRGYLPHWDFKKPVQAITFRLVISDPSSLIQEWKFELASITDATIRQKELHRRIARHEDVGHGISLLGQPACTAILQDQLIAGHSTKYRLPSTTHPSHPQR